MAKNKPHTYTQKPNGKNNVGVKEKYTREFCWNEVQEMLNHINSEEGADIVLLKELCIYRGFSHQKWSEITNKFIDDEEIQDTLKKIENILEMRLYKAGLTNQANPTMVIFGLKNKYGWFDKQEYDHSSKDGTMATKPNIYVTSEHVKQELDKLMNA